MNWRLLFILVLILAAVSVDGRGQSTALIEDDSLRAIIGESSGELALKHFSEILAFSGYSPSLGAEQTADYLAQQCRERCRWIE